LPALEGVVMELEDCAFPTLQGIVATSYPMEAFFGASWALFLAAVPRRGRSAATSLAVNVGRIPWSVVIDD
jgi:malate dehydrogenase